MTPDEFARIKALRAEGKYLAAIATEVCLHKTTVSRAVNARYYSEVQRAGLWTPEMIERLGALLAKKFSAAQVALAMHVSRNAVIGQARRRGIQLQPPGNAEATRASAQARHAKPKPRPPKIKLAKADFVREPYTPPPDTFEPRQPRPYADLDRKMDECSWPIGDGDDMLICCELVVYGSWCSHHHRVGRQLWPSKRIKFDGRVM